MGNVGTDEPGICCRKDGSVSDLTAPPLRSLMPRDSDPGHQDTVSEKTSTWLRMSEGTWAPGELV